MRRLLIPLALFLLLAGTLVASAASLSVDGGTLQVFQHTVDLCEDDPELCDGGDGEPETLDTEGSESLDCEGYEDSPMCQGPSDQDGDR